METVETPAVKKSKPRQRLSSNRQRVIVEKKQQTFSVLGIEQFASKVDFICRNIKYPEAFIKDLIKNLRLVADNGSIQPLFDCINSWEATAELDASPQTRQRVLKTYSDFKSGKIKTTSSRKKFLELVNAE